MMQGAASPFLPGWPTPPPMPGNGHAGLHSPGDVGVPAGLVAAAGQPAPVPTQAPFHVAGTDKQLPAWYHRYYASQVSQWGQVPSNLGQMLNPASVMPQSTGRDGSMVSGVHQGQMDSLAQPDKTTKNQAVLANQFAAEDIFTQAHNQLLTSGYPLPPSPHSSSFPVQPASSPFSPSSAMPGPDRGHHPQTLPQDHIQKQPTVNARPENRLRDDMQRMPPPSEDVRKDFGKSLTHNRLPPFQSLNRSMESLSDNSFNTQFPPNKNIADYSRMDTQKLPGAPKAKRTKKDTNGTKQTPGLQNSQSVRTDLQESGPFHSHGMQRFHSSSDTGNVNMPEMGRVSSHGVGGKPLDFGRTTTPNTEAANSRTFPQFASPDAGGFNPADIQRGNLQDISKVAMQGVGRVSPQSAGRVTPQDFGKVTPQSGGRVTPQDFGRLTPKDFGRVTPQDVGRVTPQEFGRVTPQDVGRVTPHEFGRVTPQDFGRVTPQDFGRVIPQDVGRVTPQEFGRVTPQDVGRVTPQEFGRVTPQDVGRVTPQEFGRVTPQDVGRVTPQEFGRVTPQDVGRVTPQEFGRVIPQDVGRVTPQEFGRLTPKDFGRITPQNVGALNLQRDGRMNLQDHGQVNPQESDGYSLQEVDSYISQDMRSANLQGSDIRKLLENRSNSMPDHEQSVRRNVGKSNYQEIAKLHPQIGSPPDQAVKRAEKGRRRPSQEDPLMKDLVNEKVQQILAACRDRENRGKAKVTDNVKPLQAHAQSDRNFQSAPNNRQPNHPLIPSSNYGSHPPYPHGLKSQNDLKTNLCNIMNNSSTNRNVAWPVSQPTAEMDHTSNSIVYNHSEQLNRNRDHSLAVTEQGLAAPYNCKNQVESKDVGPPSESTNQQKLPAEVPDNLANKAKHIDMVSQNSNSGSNSQHTEQSQESKLKKEHLHMNDHERPCCRECEILGIRNSANCKNRINDRLNIMHDPYSFDDSEEKHPYLLKPGNHRKIIHPNMSDKVNLHSQNNSHFPNHIDSGKTANDKTVGNVPETNGSSNPKDTVSIDTGNGEQVKDFQQYLEASIGDPNYKQTTPNMGNTAFNPAAAFRQQFEQLLRHNMSNNLPTESTNNTLPNFASSWGHRPEGSYPWPPTGHMMPPVEGSAQAKNKLGKRPAVSGENGQVVKRRGRKPGSVNKKKLAKSKSLEDLTKIPTTNVAQSAATVEFPAAGKDTASQLPSDGTPQTATSEGVRNHVPMLLGDSAVDMKVGDEAPVPISKDKVASIAEQVEELQLKIAGEDDVRNKHLVSNQIIDVPECGCRGPGVASFNEALEGPYYTHLGSGRSVKAIRETMEQRTGVTGKALRIEKIRYSGREGKSSQGCPIAKWIVRRSGLDEKYLCVVRHRPDHYCESAWIICAIVAWEGVATQQADDLYDYLVATLPEKGFETERRCGTNDRKTCACQGVDLQKRGASFSFGCSWSMYFNGCKFARSQVAHKFKLKNTSQEPVIEDKLQNLANKVGPLYKQIAPEAHDNQCFYSPRGMDCRLGADGLGPFGGVTACVDFCAHAHKDVQNMNNGSTVVVTLTKHRGISKPDDEQLHVLPLYVLESTDEHGSVDGQYEKIQNGSLEALHQYQLEARIRAQPLISAKRRRRLEQEARRKEKLSPGKHAISPGRGRTSPWGSPPPSAPSTPQKGRGRKDKSFLHSQDSNQSLTDSLPGSMGGTPIKVESHKTGTAMGTPVKVEAHKQKGSKKIPPLSDNDKPLSYEDLMSASNLPGFSGLYDSFWEYFYSHGSFPPPSFLAAQPGLHPKGIPVKQENGPPYHSANPTAAVAPARSSATPVETAVPQPTTLQNAIKQEVKTTDCVGDTTMCNITSTAGMFHPASRQTENLYFVQSNSGSNGDKCQSQKEQKQTPLLSSANPELHKRLNHPHQGIDMTRSSVHNSAYISSSSTSQARSQSDTLTSDLQMAAIEHSHTQVKSAGHGTSDNHIKSLAATQVSCSMQTAVVSSNETSVNISSEGDHRPPSARADMQNNAINSSSTVLPNSSADGEKEQLPSDFMSESALDLSNSGSRTHFQELRKAASLVRSETSVDQYSKRDMCEGPVSCATDTHVKLEYPQAVMSTCVSSPATRQGGDMLGEPIGGVGQLAANMAHQQPLDVGTPGELQPRNISVTGRPTDTINSTAAPTTVHSEAKPNHHSISNMFSNSVQMQSDKQGLDTPMLSRSYADTPSSLYSDTKPSYYLSNPFSDSPRKNISYHPIHGNLGPGHTPPIQNEQRQGRNQPIQSDLGHMQTLLNDLGQGRTQPIKNDLGQGRTRPIQNDLGQGRNQPTQIDLGQGRNQPTPNDMGQGRNQPTPNDLGQGRNQPTPNDMGQGRNQPTPNDMGQGRNQPTQNDLGQGRNQPTPNELGQGRNQPTPNDLGQGRNQPTPNDLGQGCNEPIQNVLGQSHNQPIRNDSVQGRNQPTPNDLGQGRNHPIQNNLGQGHIQPIRNELCQGRNQPTLNDMGQGRNQPIQNNQLTLPSDNVPNTLNKNPPDQGHDGQGQNTRKHQDIAHDGAYTNYQNEKLGMQFQPAQGHVGQGQIQKGHPNLGNNGVPPNQGNNRSATPIHPSQGHVDQKDSPNVGPSNRYNIDSSAYQGYNGSMYDYDPSPLAGTEKPDLKGNFLSPGAKASPDHDQIKDDIKCETEYNEEPFKDPTVGGVAIALCHGAVLFEVAKRELHATTGLRNPDRYDPTRISLVFYQHKNLNFKRHGMYRYAKKLEDMKQKKLVEMQEKTGGAVDASEVEAMFKGGKKRKIKTETPAEGGAEEEEEVVDIMKTSAAQYRYMWPCPVGHATSVTTNTVVTRWIDPQPMVSGPYQKWV